VVQPTVGLLPPSAPWKRQSKSDIYGNCKDNTNLCCRGFGLEMSDGKRGNWKHALQCPTYQRHFIVNPPDLSLRTQMWEGNTAIKGTGWWYNGLKQFFPSAVRKNKRFLVKIRITFPRGKDDDPCLCNRVGTWWGIPIICAKKYGWSTSHQAASFQWTQYHRYQPGSRLMWTRDGVGAAKERINLVIAGNRSLYSQPVIFWPSYTLYTENAAALKVIRTLPSVTAGPQSLIRNSEIRKALESGSFEPHQAWCAGRGVSWVSVFVSLRVNIQTFRCRNINVFDNTVLSHSMLAMSRNIRYMHRFAVLKSEEFLIPKHVSPPKCFE